MQPAPRERSVFRKNIGRALLNLHNDSYLQIWEIDFTSRKKREKLCHLRNIEKEKEIELEITRILRDNFAFRVIKLDRQTERLGKAGLERFLIGTVAHCKICRPSIGWLGHYSPINQIRESGLWLQQHLKADIIKESHKKVILDAIKSTELLL